MNEIKRMPIPGPWRIVEREVMEDGSVYPRHIVGGEGDYEVCLLEGPATAELAVKHGGFWGNNANGDQLVAAPDMVMALELIAADADAGNSRLTSGVRMALDAALIKAGRKKAPVRTGE